MDWTAPHAGYVLAAYGLAAAVWLWCIVDTWLGGRRARRNRP